MTCSRTQVAPCGDQTRDLSIRRPIQNSIYAVTNMYGSHGIMKVSAELQDERNPEKILLYSLVQAMSMKIALTST